VAVCLTGQARTLVYPPLWRSLRENVLDNGKLELFAVIGTGGDGMDRLDGTTAHYINDQWLAEPKWLALPLEELRMTKVRLVLDTLVGRTPCEQDDTLQFLAWAECARMVLEESRADWLFHTRADVYWTSHMPLSRLAHHLDPDVVVTSNDHHMLASHAALPILASLVHLKPPQCEAEYGDLCNGRSPVIDRQFDRFNAYCVQVALISRHGLRHIETSHPGCRFADKRLHLRVLNTHPLLQPLSYRTGAAQHIARWSEPPCARRPRGVRIVCSKRAYTHPVNASSPRDGHCTQATAVECHPRYVALVPCISYCID